MNVLDTLNESLEIVGGNFYKFFAVPFVSFFIIGNMGVLLSGNTLIAVPITIFMVSIWLGSLGVIARMVHSAYDGEVYDSDFDADLMFAIKRIPLFAGLLFGGMVLLAIGFIFFVIPGLIIGGFLTVLYPFSTYFSNGVGELLQESWKTFRTHILLSVLNFLVLVLIFVGIVIILFLVKNIGLVFFTGIFAKTILSIILSAIAAWFSIIVISYITVSSRKILD